MKGRAVEFMFKVALLAMTVWASSGAATAACGPPLTVC